MTTQEQKDRKVEAAEKQATDVAAKRDKLNARLVKLEADYTAARNELVARVEALNVEVNTAQEHVDWVRAMPVSGRASGEVGAVTTPAADAE